MEGYNLVRQDRHVNSPRKGGGLCVYLKNNLAYEIVGENATRVTKDYEVLGVVIKPPNMKKINILRVYRPPEGNVNNLMEYLEGAIGELNRDRHETILIGDFNMDYSDNRILRIHKILGFQNNLNLKQIIESHTRVTLLVVPKVQNVRYYKSLFYRAVLTRNNLDPRLTLIDSKGNFKNALY